MEHESLKAWMESNLNFPNFLTEEEKHLKSKYALLKEMKHKLHLCEITRKCSTTRRIVKGNENLNKCRNQERSETNNKRTCDFKKSVKRQSHSGIKRSIPKYSFEDDVEPRSIIIRGRDLTDTYVRNHFETFGYIWRIKTNESKTASVLSFKRPNSAKTSAETMNGKIVDGIELKVSLMKPKNTSWCNLSTKDNFASTISEIKNSGRSVHLKLTGILTSNDLEEFFQHVGRTTRIYINSRKRFGFVTFENQEQAQRAIRDMNGEIYKGVKVFVSPQMFLDFIDKKETESPEKNEREAISYGDIEP